MLVNKGHKLILGREKGHTYYVYGSISRDHDVAVKLDGLEDELVSWLLCLKL